MDIKYKVNKHKLTKKKTFDDLVFEVGSSYSFTDGHARFHFDNGYGISVITGGMSYTTSGTYEIAVLKDGRICYDTPITNDVIGHLSPDEVTEIMLKIQNLK